MTQSTETVSQRAREIADHFMEAEGDGIVRDMASHVGSEVHDVLKRHGMMMKTVAGAIGMGTLAAVAVLNSTEEFARRSMNDEGEANSVADAIWALFQAELSPAFARVSTNKDETIAKLQSLLADYADFAGETAGVCLGLAMSTEHPAPDEALMEVFKKSQALATKRRTALTSTEKEG